MSILGDELVSKAEERNLKSVSDLIKLGADVNHTRESGESALMKAVENEDVNMVDLLLKQNADPRKPISIDGDTYKDMTYYFSRRYCNRMFSPKNEKFRCLVLLVHYQKELLNDPHNEGVRTEINECISHTKSIR